MSDHNAKLSKQLSYILRHNPSSVDLVLDDAGWVDLDQLVAALNRTDTNVTTEDILGVVATSPKQRFQFIDGRIRAAQGHSVEVDLKLEPATPPAVLYHGTVQRFLASIEAEGLRPGNRQHVHLSADLDTAEVVGQRRGKPIVLIVDAQAMQEASYVFYQSSNGVWLTGAVPPAFIRLRPQSSH